MNYKLIIILLGGLMMVGAMIPYAYKVRCQSADCVPERPY